MWSWKVVPSAGAESALVPGGAPRNGLVWDENVWKHPIRDGWFCCRLSSAPTWGCWTCHVTLSAGRSQTTSVGHKTESASLCHFDCNPAGQGTHEAPALRYPFMWAEGVLEFCATYLLEKENWPYKKIVCKRQTIRHCKLIFPNVEMSNIIWCAHQFVSWAVFSRSSSVRNLLKTSSGLEAASRSGTLTPRAAVKSKCHGSFSLILQSKEEAPGALQSQQHLTYSARFSSESIDVLFSGTKSSSGGSRIVQTHPPSHYPPSRNCHHA